MRSEDSGIWFVPANDGNEAAALIKAPTSTLKSLLVGAELKFIFGFSDNNLCCGVRIYDVPEAPLLLSNTQRHLEEHEALLLIARNGIAPVFLYNEMDVCMAWSDGYISTQSQESLVPLVSNPKSFYTGKPTDATTKVLDSFCNQIDPDIPGAGIPINLLEVPITHGSWVLNQVSFVGFRESHTITLDDPDEGSAFEKATWASFESVFPLTLYRSPQVVSGSKARELTDVLTSYEHGAFLIEAKDLSVIRARKERTRHRRLKGIQKQTKKAIGQLIGASRMIDMGKTITDHTGNELSLALDQPLHCIVLLTELMHEGDWSEIVAMLKKAMIETENYFHVLDLRELIKLLKISKGEAQLLDYNLIKRCEHFVELDSIHIRSQPDPKSL